MGLSCSWIAVEGATKEAVLDLLGMIDTGGDGGDPTGPFSCADSSAGWVIFYVGKFVEHDIQRLKALSVLGRTIGVALDERVMCSTAHGYQDGVLQWSIAHDCNKAPEHLEATGALPEIFGAVRDRLTREQHEQSDEEFEVDFIFDIPIVVAQEICGFRVDELSDDRPMFTRAQAPREPARPGGGFFSKLLGRR